MKPSEVTDALRSSNALRTGHFKLSSGRHSDTYIQCALALSSPVLAESLGRELADKLAEFKPDIIVGPAMGGVIIAHETARHLGTPCIFTERVTGEMALRRGFAVPDGATIAIVEDVITTGRSPREVSDLLTKLGGRVVCIGSIVNRAKVAFAVPSVSLVEMDVASFDPEECPQCAQGVPLDSPGSRHINA